MLIHRSVHTWGDVQLHTTFVRYFHVSCIPNLVHSTDAPNIAHVHIEAIQEDHCVLSGLVVVVMF